MSATATDRDSDRYATRAATAVVKSSRYRDIKWQPPPHDEELGFAPLVPQINWELREACRYDLRLFCEHFLSKVFYLGWSRDQLAVCERLQEVVRSGGKHCLAMPRGGGKTALCRASIIWGTAYGHIQFPFFIGSKQGKAVQTLRFVRMQWYSSALLLRDFPEIAYSIRRLGNRSHGAKGQLYNGHSTHVVWEAQEVHYPCLMLTEEDKRHYPAEDLIEIPDYDGWITKSSGVLIRTEGIDGSIRGDADVHPYTLSQPRPDFVLLDDIQKDQHTDSPTVCDKLLELIDGAIEGLGGPDQLISVVMPCTVIREGDVSDTYLDRAKKPQWNGTRYQMVAKWPECVIETTIDTASRQGKLWHEYDELRRASLREHGDIRLATDFYAQHRDEMDAGFECSWAERFHGDERYKGNRELSAQQHAMNLFLDNPYSMLAEYQNTPKRKTAGGTPILTVKEFLEERIVDVERLKLTANEQHLVAYVDVQDECLFYALFACETDFTGRFVDYGVFPDCDRISFTKQDVAKWCMLSRSYFQRHPDSPRTFTQGSRKMAKAPLEGKIYFALQNCCNFLLGRQYVRDDGLVMHLQAIGVDTKWGLVTDTVFRFAREYGSPIVLPCAGQYVGAASIPFQQYLPKAGMRISDFWIHEQSGKHRGQAHLRIDTNQVKSFLHQRLSTPKGNPGAVTVFKAEPREHELFAEHVCKSEFPEPVTAKGRTVDEWQENVGRPDNDWLDCSAGCMALASFVGARVTTIKQEKDREPPPDVRTNKDGRGERLSEVWGRKRRGGMGGR